MATCGICGGSGGKVPGSEHVPGCMRYRHDPNASARNERTKRGMGEPETKRSTDVNAGYCPICRGPHKYKHGRT